MSPADRPDPPRPDDALDRIREVQRGLEGTDDARPSDTTERTARSGVPELKPEDVATTLRAHDERSQQEGS
jgi:hypothetical protein